MAGEDVAKKEIKEATKKETLLKQVRLYAMYMKELDSRLSRYKFQRPLREAISILLKERDKMYAAEVFLDFIWKVVGKHPANIKKEIQGKEVNYETLFRNVFNSIADHIMTHNLTSKDIEIMMDLAYYHYRRKRED